MPNPSQEPAASSTHIIFYKNIVYKNLKPQIRDTIKNILTAQNV